MTTNPKSKCCGASLVFQDGIYRCFNCGNKKPQDQPTSRLDEASSVLFDALDIRVGMDEKTRDLAITTIKFAIQEYSKGVERELNNTKSALDTIGKCLVQSKLDITKANEELVAYRNFTLDIKEFTKVFICQCGEKMADTDLKIYLNMLKAKLAIIAAQEKMK